MPRRSAAGGTIFPRPPKISDIFADLPNSIYAATPRENSFGIREQFSRFGGLLYMAAYATTPRRSSIKSTRENSAENSKNLCAFFVFSQTTEGMGTDCGHAANKHKGQNIMTDMLGQQIERGVTIAYPSRKGSRMWQRAMRVLDVRGDRISGLLPSGRAVTIRRENGSDLVVCRGGTL